MGLWLMKSVFFVVAVLGIAGDKGVMRELK